MFRWEIQMHVLFGNGFEKVIVKGNDFAQAYAEAMKQAGYKFEIYSINKIWD